MQGGSGNGDSDRMPSVRGMFGLLAQNQIALTLCVSILASGVVLATLLFIWLSFTKPDAANIIIPLVITPLLGVCVAHGRRLIAKHFDETPAAPKQIDAAERGDGELGADKDGTK